MTPKEIIKKQAEAVTGFNKLTAAEHLEAAAKLLRQEAGQKEQTGLAAIKAWKEQAKKKGAAAFTALGNFRQAQVIKALADGGWSHLATFEKEGVQQYCKKNVSGSKLIIRNGKFRVYAADTMLCDWTDTQYLQVWIDKQNKK